MTPRTNTPSAPNAANATNATNASESGTELGQSGCILVGYGPEDRGRGGLGLARMLAQSADMPVVVACVVPDRWGSISPARQADADYQRYLRGLADESLRTAAEEFAGATVPVRYEVVTARSSPSGLTAAGERYGAKILVLGSSSDGAWGHIALGSVSDHLLHSSRIPIALAPRGQRCTPAQRVERVTVAVDGSEASRAVLTRAASVAATVGAQLRIVSFAVRTATMYPSELGLNIEDRVVAEWRVQAERIVREVASGLDVMGQGEPELHVAQGKSWAEALEEPGWDEGDVLVIGSSSTEPRLARVFLGSTATRITRHSPVPVIVVP